MKRLPEGNTYPFETFPLEERIDLVKAPMEVYYCLFRKDTPTGIKLGLFRNNLKGDGVRSSITESYTVIGEEFGYDEVKVCPAGVGPHYALTIFVSLVKNNPETCDIVTISEEDGAAVLLSGKNLQECSDALKDYLGMRLSFSEPDYFEERKRHVDSLVNLPSSDALYKIYGGKYEFTGPPATIRNYVDNNLYRVGVVKKANGKKNILNYSTGEEFSPVDFDDCCWMSRKTAYSFRIGNNWYTADWNGVLPDYRLGAKGWYSYDCLPALLAGEDISQYKQDQYQEHRETYAYYDPNVNNPDTLIEKMKNWAANIQKKK